VVALVGDASPVSNGPSAVIAARVGKPVVVMLRVRPLWGVRMVSGMLIVAAPGTQLEGVGPGGGSPPFALPPGATAMPDFELATAPIVGDAEGNALVSLTFTPPAAGTYPVFVGGTFSETTDCSSTAPVDGAPGGASFETQTGTIVAR
jgi:hypothetical protein